MTMAEYIDKNALDRALSVAAANGKDKDHRTWAKAICVLHDMPAADAAPVVRCSECVYHHDCGTHFCDRLGMDLDDLNFSCSYGERRRDEHH